jgi:Ca2+-binding EF-hand superfamily protein
MNLFEQAPLTKEQIDKIKATFGKFDANHDGFLSLEEWKTFMKAKLGDEKYNSKEAKLIAGFHSTDKNHDGKVSLDEIIQKMATEGHLA